MLLLELQMKLSCEGSRCKEGVPRVSVTRPTLTQAHEPRPNEEPGLTRKGTPTDPDEAS